MTWYMSSRFCETIGSSCLFLSLCLKPSDGCRSLQSNQITAETVMEVYDVYHKENEELWVDTQDEEWDNDRIWDEIEDDYYLYNDDDDYDNVDDYTIYNDSGFWRRAAD
ncbi:hypothetical protein N7475_000219 [Penicillium sp. IBT 31633x]|nr:hypothetical protein N7475_000219 [Penicillium sp. IBT 31633x]